MNVGLRQIDLDFIIDVLKRTPEVDKALIFGSRAKEIYHRGSDVDLAVIGSDIDIKIISHLHFVLEEESPMPYFIDIVDYTHLMQPELKKEIDDNGVVIYERFSGKQ